MRIVARIGGLAIFVILAVAAVSRAGDRSPVQLYRVNVDSIIRAAPPVSGLEKHHLVCLLHSEEIDIGPNYSWAQTIRRIMLVTSLEGIRMAGTEVISYMEGFDSVVVHEARSISPNGDKIGVSPDQIILGQISEELVGRDLYTHQREVHINHTGIEVGSIVESLVTVMHPGTALKDFAFTAFLGDQRPTGLALVSIRHDSDIRLFSRARVVKLEPVEWTRRGRKTRTWLAKYLPPVVIEPGSKPFADLAPRVDFSSYATWEEYGNILRDSMWQEDLEEPLSKPEREYFERLVKDCVTPTEKAKSLYYSVQDDIRYLGLEFGLNNIKPFPSREVWEGKSGDCKGKSNLLVKMLRRAGIDAYPAILATADATMSIDRDFPSYNLLNHAIVYVPDCEGEEYWLDPTLGQAPIGWIPPYLQTASAIVLAEDSVSVRTLGEVSPRDNATMSRVRVELDCLGNARLSGKMELTGVPSIMYMKPAYRYSSSRERDQMIESYFLANATAASDFRYTLAGQDHHDSALVLETSYVETGYAQIAGDLLILRQPSEPIGMSLDIAGSMSTRYTDLLLRAPSSYDVAIDWITPPGYELRSCPGDFSTQNRFFDYSKVFSIVGADHYRLTVELTVKSLVVGVDEFQEYRSLVEQINADYRERPVFELAD